jgi:hypothetical protein
MTAAPDEELSRIARFLGASGDVKWRAGLETNISAERIRKFPGYSVIVDNPVAGALRRALVPQVVRARIKANLQMRDRPELSTEKIIVLNAEFDRDLDRLSGLFSEKFSRDTFTARPQVGLSEAMPAIRTS